ncbi:MAG TPA: phage protease [Kiritimatiellia bacterium]|nr:phage protease [Kiritimatiellia bacterium]
MIATPFNMPEDGWYHISAVGEFPHNPTGLVQVIDPDSLDAIVGRFSEAAAAPNFPGILIDFDHSSLDQDKPTEAAGWIVGLDKRPDGLWAQIRWSDRGDEAVRGGRYRFISPVWHRDECVDLGEKRVRPTRLINCAVTNDPNIPGLVPLSNSARPLSDEQRKAIWAKGGGGGGGGAPRSSSAPSAPGWRETDSGWEYAGATPTLPAKSVSPVSPTDPDWPEGDFAAAPREPPTSARLEAMRAQRAQLEANRPDPAFRPEAPVDPRQKIDPKAVFKEALRSSNDLNAAWAAKKEAEAQIEYNKATVNNLRRELRQMGVTDREAQNKAIDKYLKQRQRQYEKDLEAFDRATATFDKYINRLDLDIAHEETRLTDAENRQLGKETEAAQAAERAKLRAQVAADKDAERKRQADEKARLDKEKQSAAAAKRNDPATQYRSEVNRRRTYWEALERGDLEHAKRIYPDADHQQNLADLAELQPKSGSKASDKVYATYFAELRQQAP